MAEAQMKPMSVAAFLAWEQEQSGRFELVGGRPVAMTGGTRAHDEVRLNLAAWLREALRGKPCRVHTDVKVLCGKGNVRVPDVLVCCGPNQPGGLLAVEPRIVVKVVSPSARATDFLVELADYNRTPSISTYLICWQSAVKMVVFRRYGEHLGLAEMREGLTAAIELPDVGLTLALADVYDRVDLPAAVEMAAF